MYIHYIQLPSITYKIDTRISKNLKYEPYFGDCLGNLDGTHISAHFFFANQILY